MYTSLSVLLVCKIRDANKQQRYSKDFPSRFQTEVCKPSLDSFGDRVFHCGLEMHPKFFITQKLWFWVYFYKESENEIWFIFTSVNMLGTKKGWANCCWKTNKKSWFNFPQDFLGLGCKCLCYQKLSKRGKGKRQWRSQQLFELCIWSSGNVDLEST